jgi:hypothetical protein
MFADSLVWMAIGSDSLETISDGFVEVSCRWGWRLDVEATQRRTWDQHEWIASQAVHKIFPLDTEVELARFRKLLRLGARRFTANGRRQEGPDCLPRSIRPNPEAKVDGRRVVEFGEDRWEEAAVPVSVVSPFQILDVQVDETT